MAMNEMEQMMMQLWLSSLKNKLKADQVDEVIEELTIALTRIEEDIDASHNNNGTKGESTAEPGDDAFPEDSETGDAGPKSDTKAVGVGGNNGRAGPSQGPEEQTGEGTESTVP